MDIVSDAAEESMRSAIEEVKSLPHYSENGEVMKLYCIAITENPSSFLLNSGLSQMLDMTPLLTPTTRLCLASREGEV